MIFINVYFQKSMSNIECLLKISLNTSQKIQKMSVTKNKNP